MPGDYNKKFEFPECWNNDIRMSALFAPFRSKSVNPTDWNSKMKFWTNLIESWCKHNKCPIVEVSNLKNNFSRKGSIPVCLEEVILHLSSTGILVDKDSFMTQNENWKSWAIKILVTKPLKWTFNTIASQIVKGNEHKEVSYVHLPTVKYLGEVLQKDALLMSSQGKIFNFEDLMQYGFEAPENLSVVLHWMQNQGLVTVSQENNVTLVKLCKSAAKPVKITEVDLGIYNLETQQKLLEENIKKLESERNEALEETKKYLAAKLKNMAKVSLRKKKALESTIEKRAVTLESIQTILHKIEQAKLDSEVFECYQTGISTLKQIYKETGLNAKTVTGTMKELEEVLNSRNEIEEVLSRPMDPELEGDYEDELNELLLENAPDIPAGELPVNTMSEKTKSKDANEVMKQLEVLSIW